jgi:hypothetical protein
MTPAALSKIGSRKAGRIFPVQVDLRKRKRMMPKGCHDSSHRRGHLSSEAMEQHINHTGSLRGPYPVLSQTGVSVQDGIGNDPHG